jgi:hypothetical protein
LNHFGLRLRASFPKSAIRLIEEVVLVYLPLKVAALEHKVTIITSTDHNILISDFVAA